MPDLMGIGVSGLLAYQNALSTVSHNISNAGNEGYSRQKVTLATRVPQLAGNGYFGQGVDVTSVTRVYDQFLVGQARTYQSLSGSSQAFYDLSAEVDKLLADPAAGLSPTVESFFSAVQGVSNNPSSIPARQVMLTAAQTMVDRFGNIDQRLDDLQQQVQSQMTVIASEINQYASAIANLNREIAQSNSVSGQAPNDLLDRRDQLLSEMAKRVTVSTVEQSNGVVNVFVGKGQALVVDATASSLRVQANEYQSGVTVQMGVGAAFNDVTSVISGGSLGGNLDFANQVLDPARRNLGRVATGLATEFNTQHGLGLDLTGAVGTDFFAAPVPSAFPGSGNSATGGPTLDVKSVSALTGDDYELRYNGAAWSLLNLTTKQSVPLAVGTGTSADPWVVDGMTIAADTIAGAVAGDRFLIRSTATGAANIGLRLSDPSRIAAAGPFTAAAATDANGLPTNTGSGNLTQLSTSALADTPALIPLGGALTLSFDSVGNQYTLALPAGINAVPATISYNPASDDGVTRSLTLSDGTNSVQLSFRLSGIPQNGDQILINDASASTGDNRNALALAGIADSKMLINGTASVQGAYGQIVAEVGAITSRAKTNSEAETTLLGQAIQARDSVSGVNLDEEAANLVRFQQAYQASAQVILAAKTMFDTLLGAVR